MISTRDSWQQDCAPNEREFPRQQRDLADKLERSIELKAQGRIRDLRVFCLDGSIVLEGSARTYHAKQLAQEAVLSETDGRVALSNHIVVA
jgi:hypothetical protein